MDTYLDQVAKEIASEICAFEVIDDHALIRTSVALPSGAMVVICIKKTSSIHYTVSDLQMGQNEARLLGVCAKYDELADDAASWRGIDYDDGAMMLKHIRRQELTAAVIVIANDVARILNTVQPKVYHET